MYFEIAIQRIIIDPKSGNDKTIKELYFVDKVELFGEAEMRGLELYPNNADVIAIKISSIREFVNTRTSDEQSIFVATIEDIFTSDDGEEKVMKYKVALFAKDIHDATRITSEYMKMGISDMNLVGMKRTKFIDIL
jgi:hypothetical protein